MKSAKALSVALAIVTAASMMSGCARNSSNSSTESAGSASSAVSSWEAIPDDGSTESDSRSAEEILTDAMSSVLKAHSSTTGKEETVYVISDSNGAAQNIIVSDWLKNGDAADTIQDETELKDVTNVNGYETYTDDGDGKLTWQADGSDIYYQGTTDKKLPVEVSISYKLDGKDIAPEDLAGKSGRVTIRFDYTNNQTKTVTIGGEEQEIKVPFGMVTGVLLPEDHFDNITVTNGRTFSEGKNNIVLGVAFPGLKDSIDLDKLKEEAVDDEAREKIDELNIPDYVEIEADATDFELEMTMTAAMSNLLSALNLTDSIDTSSVTDSMDELQDGADELVDGTQTLKDGTADLASGADELKDGTQILKDGSSDLASGAQTLKDGTSDLKDGVQTLKDGTTELKDGSSQLASGTDDLASGTDELASGTDSLVDGVGTLKNGTSQLANGAGDLKTGTDTLKNGTSQLASGANDLKAGTDTLKNGTQELADKSKELDAGAKQVDAGVESVQNGIATIQSQIPQGDSLAAIKSQIQLLQTGTSTEAEKIKEINGGAQQISSALSSMMSALTPHTMSDSDYKQAVAQLAAAAKAQGTTVEALMSSKITAAVQARGQAETSIKTLLASDPTLLTGGLTSSSGTDETGNSEGEGENNNDSDEESGRQDSGTPAGNTSLQNQMYSALVSYYQADVQLEKLLYAYMKTVKDGADELVTKTAAQETVPDSTDDWTLDTLASEVASGAEQLSSLADSLDQLNGGMQQLANGTSQLKSGTSQLSTGTGQLVAGVDQLNSGAGDLQSGAAQLADGAGQVDSGVSQLQDGAGQLKDGADQVNDGVSTLQDGANSLKDGAYQVKDGAYQVKDGAHDLDNGVGEVDDGVSDLRDGAGDLDDGAGDLLDGTNQLDDGVSDLLDGVITLADGSHDLDDGALEVRDGMIKLNDEGIKKLTELFGDNVDDVVGRINAIIDAGDDYTTFTGANANGDNNVKFIYKFGEIKNS